MPSLATARECDDVPERLHRLDAVALKMMPGRATGEKDERFRRYYSLRVGYNVLEQMRVDHNEDFPVET
jgi:hypothetical protein